MEEIGCNFLKISVNEQGNFDGGSCRFKNDGSLCVGITKMGSDLQYNGDAINKCLLHLSEKSQDPKEIDDLSKRVNYAKGIIDLIRNQYPL